MALNNILHLIAADFGLDLTQTVQRALTLEHVNKAAEELYRMTDLDGSLDEMIVNIDTHTQQVALPPNIDNVRGGRYYESRHVITVDHSVNRYQEPGYANDTWPLRFRRKSSSPICRDIENQSILKFTLPGVESSDIIISTSGETDRSSNYNEEIVLPAGSLEIETTENYKKLKSIRKNRITTYDVSISDVEDISLGIIPNSQLFSKYVIWQVNDVEYSGTLSIAGSIEIQYKKPFIPFVNDFDQFLDSDKYDLAIVEKYKELRAKNVDAFTLYQQKANQSLQIAHDDADPGTTRRKVGFPRSPFFDLPYKKYYV